MIKLAPDLTELQKEQVKDRLRPFNKTLWAITNYDLMEPINVIEHRIHVSDPAPIVRKGPPKSHAEVQALKAWNREMMECLITGRSTSLDSAPAVVILKPQEPGDTKPPEIRVCFNYRGRNDKTYGDDTACPEVLPTLQALEGGKWFGSADGKSAFHQITMAADSRRAINMILEGSSRLHSFVDDIKHGAPDWEGRLDDITDLANRATLHKLRLSPKKFYAGFRSLKGFGYIVDFQGFHPDPEKVEPILSILTPTDVTGIRSFVGMVNYYSALIPNISRWTGPLNDLTQKGRNVIRDWTEVHTQCFETLKQALADAPGLAFPDVEKRYTLTTDWQPGHTAAVLSQPYKCQNGELVERPIHYLAKKLVGYEAGWPATTGEQAAVVWGIRKLHCYLFGVDFDLVTDHKALVAMLQCQETTGKLARWSVDIYPYTFTVHHRPGKELANADGLSRTDKEIRAEVFDPNQISVPESRSVEAPTEGELDQLLFGLEDHPGPLANVQSSPAAVDSPKRPPVQEADSGFELGIDHTTERCSLDASMSSLIHPEVWSSFLDELCARIYPGPCLVYPKTQWQVDFGYALLVATYPEIDLGTPSPPRTWTACGYGMGLLKDLVWQLQSEAGELEQAQPDSSPSLVDDLAASDDEDFSQLHWQRWRSNLRKTLKLTSKLWMSDIDAEVELGTPEDADPAPEQDEHIKMRRWYWEHQDEDQEELDQYLN
ncbi:hypothetical protein WJX74_004701 [Apatococcus lobatus]|uniref:Reverse transcriptase RNase H-like domain-containing protein n=1 Tax=Apatococcus lobatus TaxID=904363 RepID=A0AAW1RVL4_9CHLO